MKTNNYKVIWADKDLPATVSQFSAKDAADWACKEMENGEPVGIESPSGKVSFFRKGALGMISLTAKQAAFELQMWNCTKEIDK